jgi:hypothetical protein
MLQREKHTCPIGTKKSWRSLVGQVDEQKITRYQQKKLEYSKELWKDHFSLCRMYVFD